ncbi:MAG: THUMP domain-containing protein [Thermofilum sp.]
MLRDFNLVVSTYRQRENDCIAELWYFAREIGDKELDASRSGLPALILAKTSLDPEVFAAKARERILENPWYFRYVLKIVPIQQVVEARIEEMVNAAQRLSELRLRPADTFKVEARIRLSELTRDKVVEAIASVIHNKVNLTNPDKVVLVEVIGNLAGV